MKAIKKTIAVAAGLGMFLSAGVALAAEIPLAGNGSPMYIMEPWGLTVGESQKYIVPSGTVLTLKAGGTLTCPFWYPAGCFDLRWHYGI
jgi:hypothetical protein